MRGPVLGMLLVASLAGCLAVDEDLEATGGDDAETAPQECLDRGEVVMSLTKSSLAPEPVAGALPHPVAHAGTERFPVSGDKTYLAMMLEADLGEVQAHYRFTVKSGSDVLQEFDLTSESSGWHAAWAVVDNVERPDTLTLDWAFSGVVPWVSYEIKETDCMDLGFVFSP